MARSFLAAECVRRSGVRVEDAIRPYRLPEMIERFDPGWDQLHQPVAIVAGVSPSSRHPRVA
jgi:hypothetical protein